MKYMYNLRSVKWKVLKMIGKKILNGKFDLTKIHFPIELCQPKSLLEKNINHCMWNPTYITLACR